MVTFKLPGYNQEMTAEIPEGVQAGQTFKFQVPNATPANTAEQFERFASVPGSSIIKKEFTALENQVKAADAKLKAREQQQAAEQSALTLQLKNFETYNKEALSMQIATRELKEKERSIDKQYQDAETEHTSTMSTLQERYKQAERVRTLLQKCLKNPVADKRCPSTGGNFEAAWAAINGQVGINGNVVLDVSDGTVHSGDGPPGAGGGVPVHTTVVQGSSRAAMPVTPSSRSPKGAAAAAGGGGPPRAGGGVQVPATVDQGPSRPTAMPVTQPQTSVSPRPPTDPAAGGGGPPRAGGGVRVPATVDQGPSRPTAILPVQQGNDAEWFYIDAHNQYVRVPNWEYMLGLRKDGHVQPETYIWQDGMNDWKQFEELTQNTTDQ